MSDLTRADVIELKAIATKSLYLKEVILSGLDLSMANLEGARGL